MQDDNNNNNLTRDFHEIFEDIKNDVTKTQFEIMVNANANLVNLYFRIGKTIYENSNWGNKFIGKNIFRTNQLQSICKMF